MAGGRPSALTGGDESTGLANKAAASKKLAARALPGLRHTAIGPFLSQALGARGPPSPGLWESTIPSQVEVSLQRGTTVSEPRTVQIGPDGAGIFKRPPKPQVSRIDGYFSCA